MRGLIAIVVLVGAVIAGGYALSKSAAGEGKLIAIAFGIAVEGEIEMHAIISSGMMTLDPPKMSVRGKTLWQEWVDDHFAMFDDAGGTLPLKYKGSTDIMTDLELRGFQQGFVVAHLKQGIDYTMEYRPEAANGGRYRHSFTAPTDKVSLTRPLFKPVQ